MPNRPTLKTIAQRAGLSHVAVSKALRDAPDISAETKERVKQIANDLGYTTNITARNLYLRRSSAIGMIVPAMGGNTAYDLIFNEISEAAAAHEFCVMLGSSQRSVSLEEKHCRIMVGNQVGAIIAAPCTGDISHIKSICGSIPVIFIGGKIAPEETYALLCDYRHSGTQAVEYLADELGHKNIMLLSYEPENLTILQKEEGFTEAMELRGLTPRILRTDGTINAMQAGEQAVDQLWGKNELPTAFWCSNDYMAIGVRNALKRHDLAVPGDISVIGHDDLYADLPDIDLTTFHTPMAELGKAAIDLAVALIEQSGDFQPRQNFRPSLVKRSTAGPAAEALVQTQYPNL